MTAPQQPGWYDDPNDASAQRYWDGADWTPHRQRRPISSSAPSQPPPSTSLPTPPSSSELPTAPASSFPPPMAMAPPQDQFQYAPPAAQQYVGQGPTMSHPSPGPGWWQASDGNWYPPDPASGYQANGYQPPGVGVGLAPGATAPVVGVGPAFSYGLAKFQAHAREILIAGAVCLVSWLVLIFLTESIVFSAILGSVVVKGGFALFLIALPLSFLIPLVGMWLMQMVIIRGSLMIVNGQTPLSLGRMFSLERVGSFAIGAVIVSVLTVIGFVMCYVPGLIFLFFASYWAYFQIGKQLNPIDAIRASFSLVWANLGTQLVFALACALVYFLGTLVCYFGLIVAIPVIVIAQGYMWRRLQGEPVAA